jgi:DNA-binding GntR family transcriptional regulator
VGRTSLIIILYEQPGRVGGAVDEHAALIDLIEKGNVAAPSPPRTIT